MSDRPPVEILGDCPRCIDECKVVNVARYINAKGQVRCALHAAHEDVPSARVCDIGRILELVQIVATEIETGVDIAGDTPVLTDSISELRTIIGR